MNLQINLKYSKMLIFILLLSEFARAADPCELTVLRRGFASKFNKFQVFSSQTDAFNYINSTVS